MKILLISPMVYPVHPHLRYGGIERLAYMAALGLQKKGHQVSVAAPEGSWLPWGIEHINTGPCGDFVESERQVLARYHHRLREFDAILSYDHSHWGMMEQDLPALAFIWHDPFMMKCQEPPYNVAALSSWQAQRFAAVYGYEARVIDPHCSPLGQSRQRNDRFLVIGRITPSKGPLEAVQLCRELGVPLDVVGALGLGDQVRYLEAVKEGASEGIRYHGEVDEDAKMELLETCRALLYPINYPPGQGEAHSHKSVDALCCGCPIVTYDVGALSEVVEHGVTGFLARDREEFKAYMGRVGELNPETIREGAAARWSVEAMVGRLLEVAERVANGDRWGRVRKAQVGAVSVVEIYSPPSATWVKYTLPPFPRQVRLDTVNACNATCIPCHLQCQIRRKGKLSNTLIEKVLDDIASWPQPLTELCPVNFGELFLRSDWYEILKLIEAKLPQTGIAFATNGSKLDDEAVAKLATVRTLRWLNFSINAYFRETYEAYTGLPVETIGKIRRAAELLRVARPDVVTNASMVYDPTLQTEKERDLFIEAWRPITRMVSINPAQYAGNPLRAPVIPVKTACRSIFDGLVVLHDGVVCSGCCWDSDGKLEVGKFPEQTLLEIWRGEKLQRLWEVHNSGRRPEIPLCRSCTFA